MAMQPASGYMATVSQISSLQWQTPFFADSSLMPGSAVETPKAAGLGPRSDQLTDSVIPCSHPASILRASLKEKISQRCCKCHAVIVRCAGPPCMWMTLTLSVCHACGNPTLTPPSAGLTAPIARTSVLPLYVLGQLSCVLPLCSQSAQPFHPLATAASSPCHTGQGLAGHPRRVNVSNDYGKTRLFTPIRSKTTALPQCARHHSA